MTYYYDQITKLLNENSINYSDALNAISHNGELDYPMGESILESCNILAGKKDNGFYKQINLLNQANFDKLMFCYKKIYTPGKYHSEASQISSSLSNVARPLTQLLFDTVCEINTLENITQESYVTEEKVGKDVYKTTPNVIGGLSTCFSHLIFINSLVTKENIRSLIKRVTSSNTEAQTAHELRKFLESSIRPILDESEYGSPKRKKLTDAFQIDFGLMMGSEFPVSVVKSYLSDFPKELKTAANLQAAIESEIAIDDLKDLSTQKDFNAAIFISCNKKLNELDVYIRPLANNSLIRLYAESIIYLQLNRFKKEPAVIADPRDFIHLIHGIDGELKNITGESEEKLKELYEKLTYVDLTINPNKLETILTEKLSVTSFLQENGISNLKHLNNKINTNDEKKIIERFNKLKESNPSRLNQANFDLMMSSKYPVLESSQYILGLESGLISAANLQAALEGKLLLSGLSSIKTQEDFNKAILYSCDGLLINLDATAGWKNDENIKTHAKSLHTKLVSLKNSQEIKADPREFLHVITVINNALETGTKESIEELQALGNGLSSKNIWKAIGITMMILGAAIAIAAGIALTIGSVGIATPLGVGIAVVGGFGVASALAGGFGFFAGSNNNEGLAGLSADIDNLQQALTVK